MIDISKLRVGNHVRPVNPIFGIKIPHIIKSIGDRCVTDAENTNWVTCYGSLRPDQMEGIPLTDSIMLNHGFGIPVNYLSTALSEVTYSINSSFPKIYRKEGSTEFKLQFVGTVIKYLHELQNIYFAITGTELKKKDEVKNYGESPLPKPQYEYLPVRWIKEWVKSDGKYGEIADVYSFIGKHLKELDAAVGVSSGRNVGNYNPSPWGDLANSLGVVGEGKEKEQINIGGRRQGKTFQTLTDMVKRFIAIAPFPELVTMKADLTAQIQKHEAEINKKADAEKKKTQDACDRLSGAKPLMHKGAMRWNDPYDVIIPGVFEMPKWPSGFLDHNMPKPMWGMDFGKREPTIDVNVGKEMEKEVPAMMEYLKNVSHRCTLLLPDGRKFDASTGAFLYDAWYSSEKQLAAVKHEEEKLKLAKENTGWNSKYRSGGNSIVIVESNSILYNSGPQWFKDKIQKGDIVRRDPLVVDTYRVYDHATGQLKAKVDSKFASFLTGNNLPTT